MDFLKIKYKDREYLIEELLKETKELHKELTLPKEFQINWAITEWGLVNDKGYAIAGDKFNDLYSMLASARFALINAHTKIQNNLISWESGYVGQLWLRSQFLQNSIVWYNCCEDYIMQIIWFAFDFYKDLSNYTTEMRRCRYSNIRKGLAEYINLPNSQILIEKIESFHNDQSISINRKYADLTKHNQILRFKGLDHGRLIEVNSNNFSSKLIEPFEIDIDDTIDTLRIVHGKVIEIGKFLLDFINFNGMFIYDEKGRRQLLEPRPQLDYKKISINSKIAT
jgi:hypothetical protein